MQALVIAHRGASGYLPEHTLAAKTLAHKMGADYLEQDVVASRDDELVVLHDIFLDRVSNVASRFEGRERNDGRFYVRDFSLEELRSLHIWERMKLDGSPVFPDRYPPRTGEFHIHTLGEEIELTQRLNQGSAKHVGIYPEIKRPDWHRQEGIDIAPRLLGTLADYGYRTKEDRVFIQCFDDAEIHRLRHDLSCPFRLVQLIGDNSWLEAATDYDSLRSASGIRKIAESADAIGPNISHLYKLQKTDCVPVSTGLAGLAHDNGLLVHPYTFRADDIPPGFASFEALVRYFVADIGIDGLFTDFPDRVLELRLP